MAPQEIVANNDAQFIFKRIRQFRFNQSIELRMSKPRFPQGNDHVEAANKIVVSSMKKRLIAKKG